MMWHLQDKNKHIECLCSWKKTKYLQNNMVVQHPVQATVVFLYDLCNCIFFHMTICPAVSKTSVSNILHVVLFYNTKNITRGYYLLIIENVKGETSYCWLLMSGSMTKHQRHDCFSVSPSLCSYRYMCIVKRSCTGSPFRLISLMSA